jgi:hypothetical protein
MARNRFKTYHCILLVSGGLGQQKEIVGMRPHRGILAHSVDTSPDPDKYYALDNSISEGEGRSALSLGSGYMM